MASQFASVVTAFAICFLILPVIIKYSLKKNIGDEPGLRKVHRNVTPSMGGIAIFIGFIIASLIWIDTTRWVDVRVILIALVMIFFIGVRDDLVPLKPITKIAGQAMAALILILVYDLRLKSMYGLLGFDEIPLWFSYCITIFTVIVITNSFNLIDGLDGLAGTIGSIAMAAFGAWFFLAGDIVYAILCSSMLGALLGFLIFNWEPSKVFMGDTGAMVVGMTLSIATIHFIDFNYNLPVSNPLRFTATVSAAVAVLIIPLADTLRIFLVRMLRKQSPFTADKSHIHHHILHLTGSHRTTTIILAVFQIVTIGAVVQFMKTSDNRFLAGILIAILILNVGLELLVRSRKDKPVHNKTPAANEGMS